MIHRFVLYAHHVTVFSSYYYYLLTYYNYKYTVDVDATDNDNITLAEEFRDAALDVNGTSTTKSLFDYLDINKAKDSPQGLTLYGPKFGDGMRNEVDVYFVTNSDYQAYKMYDTKVTFSRGIKYSSEGAWSQHLIDCSSAVTSTGGNSILICAKGNDDRFCISQAKWSYWSNGEWKTSRTWGIRGDGVCNTRVPSYNGKECVKYNIKNGKFMYTSKRPIRQTAYPFCKKKSTDAEDWFGQSQEDETPFPTLFPTMEPTVYIDLKKKCIQDCKDSDKLSTQQKRICKQNCREQYKGKNLFN